MVSSTYSNTLSPRFGTTEVGDHADAAGEVVNEDVEAVVTDTVDEVDEKEEEKEVRL